jgi:hypothetical protein
MWQERPAMGDTPVVWRIRIEDVRTRERHAFANLEEVLSFLKERTGHAEGASNDRSRARDGVLKRTL